MDLGIRGRKAIVNGGSAGMGKEAAFALAREGASLVVSARGEARLKAACRDIAEATGAEVTPIVADHSTDQGRERILAACPEPDILVGTCAPPPRTPDFQTITVEDWRQSLDVALLSPVQFIQAVVPGMQARKWGRIVNIATVAAKSPAVLRILSGGPRAALANYVVAISKPLAKDGVTINNVLPGMFHTATVHDEFTARAKAAGTSYEEEVEKFAIAWRIPSGQFGDGADVGAFVALLCSQFAGYITGQSIVMDGGATTSTF